VTYLSLTVSAVSLQHSNQYM